MKRLLIAAIFLVTVSFVSAQEKNAYRYIEVTGKAEAEVDPDEFILSLTIEEYWEEEFKKRADEKDYRTKVPISRIENNLINALTKAGIQKDQITVQGMGNFWRERGKDFLISKQLEIKLNDFSMVNKLSELADTKGFKNMYIREMKNTRIEEIEKQVRMEALQNAREKATYLLESIGEKPDKILTISETQENRWEVPYKQNMLMRSVAESADMDMETVDQLKKIKISYQIFTRFAIAD